jgi:Dehydrogenases with different specificities (related to short-chain alcohol dehydrogenases)
MYPDLSERVAVVTGGSRGIGNAIVRRLAQEKMSVVVSYYHDERSAEKTVDELKSFGGRAIAVKADVRTEKGVRALLTAAIVELDGLDVWINSAGIETRSPTHRLTLEDWNRVMNVNLTGTFLGARTAIKYFLHQRQKGNVINLSSVHQRIPLPNFAHYAASKGGVAMLSETIACEYAGHGIRVNGIAPGVINAEKFADPEQKKVVSGRIPSSPAGSPEQVAAVAAWLASDESSFVTGATIFVDGGMSLYPECAEAKD